LTGHGELEGLGSPLLDQPGHRHRGRADREVAELGVIAKGLADRERIRGGGRQAGEDRGVHEELDQGCHEWEYKGVPMLRIQVPGERL
jgi:hypothetical protein